MAKKTPATTTDSGVLMVVTYFTLFAVSAPIVYLANMLLPKFVVLGTMSMDIPWSIFHSMSALALIATLALPFLHMYEDRRGKMLSPIEWMVTYLGINTAGLWLITRFSDQFGLGVSSWLVIIALAVVLDLVQGVAMMAVEQSRTKN